jgi:Spy/CpxP family protein refolding chaperone
MFEESKRRKWLGRTLLPFVLTLPVCFLLSCWVLAEDQTPSIVALQRQTRHRGNKPTLDEQVGRFAKSLDLGEAQKSAVRNILQQQQQEILRIRIDPSMTGSAGIDRLRVLQETTVKRIRAVLTEEQRKKYDPLAPRKIPPTAQPSVDDWLKASAPR